MKFRDIAKGRRAVKRVRLPLVNLPWQELPDWPELSEQRAKDLAAWEAERDQGNAPPLPPNAETWVGLRVLRGDEWDQVIAHAESKGAEGSERYEFAKAVATIFWGCVDPDAKDPTLPEARFFQSIEEITSSDHLGRDGILWLCQVQEYWQDANDQALLKLSVEDVWAKVVEVATSKEPDPLFRLKPGLQWIYMRTMANLLLSSPMGKSISGSESETSGSETPSESESESDPTP